MRPLLPVLAEGVFRAVLPTERERVARSLRAFIFINDALRAANLRRGRVVSAHAARADGRHAGLRDGGGGRAGGSGNATRRSRGRSLGHHTRSHPARGGIRVPALVRTGRRQCHPTRRHGRDGHGLLARLDRQPSAGLRRRRPLQHGHGWWRGPRRHSAWRRRAHRDLPRHEPHRLRRLRHRRRGFHHHRRAQGKPRRRRNRRWLFWHSLRWRPRHLEPRPLSRVRRASRFHLRRRFPIRQQPGNQHQPGG